MKYLLFLLIFVSAIPVCARQVAVSPTGSTAGNSAGQYSLDETQVQISGNQASLEAVGNSVTVSMVRAAAVAPNDGMLGLLRGSDELTWQLFDEQGREVRRELLDFFDPADETLQLLQFDDGRAIVRDNVANFSFFGVDGEMDYRVSNSSQSEYGETVSEMVSDPYGRTVVIYNPRIDYGGDEVGSRARIIRGESELTTLTQSTDRWIGYVDVSHSGSYITVVSKDDNGEDEAILFDRFGNELARLSSEEDLIGASLSENAEYMTLYSRTRTQAFRTDNGVSAGSASYQAFVIHAAFQPEDNQMVALTGTLDNNRLTDGAVHVVDFSARQIRSAEVGSVLSTLNSSDIQIRRQAANRFLITGFNRDLEVTTSF